MPYFISVFEFIAAIIGILSLPAGIFASIYSAELRAQIQKNRINNFYRGLRRLAGRVLTMDYLHDNPSALIGQIGFICLLIISQIGMVVALVLMIAVACFAILLLGPQHFIRVDHASLVTQLHRLYLIASGLSLAELLFIAFSIPPQIILVLSQKHYDFSRKRLVEKMIKRMMRRGMNKEQAENMLYSVIARR